ncbi:MAG: hypothetical protein RI601_06335 [Desulfurivibrionaceae bacterium]|nr:hypothetical protein [Desulfurivibrionaceae bacterium]
MQSPNRLTFSLFSLRLPVALVMLVWNLDKFINPEHAAADSQCLNTYPLKVC